MRETEEKIRRVKEAKEKAESEKKEKMARKKQLIDLSKDDDQVLVGGLLPLNCSCTISQSNPQEEI